MDIKYEKQKNQYNRVNDLYINKSYTIEKACEKVGICKQTYYTIKKKMENQSGGTKKSISDDKIEYTKRNNSSEENKKHKSKKKSNVRDILNVLDSQIQKTGIAV